MKLRILLFLSLTVATLAPPSWAIVRAPRAFNVFDIHAGWSNAMGNYSAIGPVNWTGGTVNASDLYDPTYHLGFDVGRLWNDKLYVGFGFRYTKIKLDNSIDTLLAGLDIPGIKFHQYDLNMDFNYYPVNPVQEAIAPYFGPGVVAGFTSVTAPGYRSQSQFNLGLNLNFGVDFRLWKAPDSRSMVVLSSMNSWNAVTTGDRPRFLNIGGAFKYFFRQ